MPIRACSALKARRRFRATAAEQPKTALEQLPCHCPRTFWFTAEPPIFDVNVAALGPSQLLETVLEGRATQLIPPLFPGYLFCGWFPAGGNARWAAGVRRLVMDGLVPACLATIADVAEIAAIMSAPIRRISLAPGMDCAGSRLCCRPRSLRVVQVQEVTC
jgi:hypothetical protein